VTNTRKLALYSAEFRVRAIRMVREHRGEHASPWAAVASIAAKIGCTAQTPQAWINKADDDARSNAGVPDEKRGAHHAQCSKTEPPAIQADRAWSMPRENHVKNGGESAPRQRVLIGLDRARWIE
jgi:transposase-like protein